MKTLIQKDVEVLEFTAGANLVSGQPVKIGAFLGIVVNDVANGEKGIARIKGVVEVTKTSAQAWAEGDRIYWDVSASEFKNTQDTDTHFAGFAAKAAANPSSTGQLLLAQPGGQAVVQAAEATADGSDAATTQALANALKVAHNALLVKLKNAGLMASA